MRRLLPLLLASLAPLAAAAQTIIPSAGSSGGGGTVTSVTCNGGLTGGAITASGTCSLNSPTAHGVLLGEGSSAAGVTATGTSGQVLTSNGASADPTYQGASTGTVTSVATGTGLTGGPVTATGTLDLAAVTAHDVMVGTGSAGAPTAVSPSTSGLVLTSNGTGSDPSFQAAASSGAQVLITETVTSGSAASVTFSSIPATYRDLVVRVRGRGDASATDEAVLMQFNSDTAADYEWQTFFAFGSGTTFGKNTAQSSIEIGDMAAGTATASWNSAVQALITDYRGTTFFKVAAATFSTNVSTSSMGAGQIGGQWNSTSAITAVKVFPASGNFVNGSVVSLYGSY